MDIETYIAHGLDRSLWDLEPGLEVNGRSNAEITAALDTPGDRQYTPCPEAHPAPGVPRGALLHVENWNGSRIYPGTVRDFWVYVPDALDRTAQPPALMVFQDGAAYLDPEGPVRATKVFDSLLASDEVPPVVGVFVNPGRPPRTNDANTDGLRAMRQRSIEYDSCTPAYGRFLAEDVLPLVEQKIGRRLTTDPARRVICGISSGGICAFNVAWHAPESFGRVLSHCGSFTNIRGGHNYPYLVRTTARKPIRVLLQSGVDDADILYGSWPLANQAMASALSFAGYDHRFVFGAGGHSLRHGGATFADSLRWLLR